jgi:hypothetical protein
MKKFMNVMSIIGVFTVIAALAVSILFVKDKVSEKSEVRKQNEYVYTQIDEFMEDVHADRSITIDRCSNGDYKITYNNGHVNRKYDFVRSNGTIDEYK